MNRLFLLVLGSTMALGAPLAAQVADTIILNGHVYAADGSGRFAQAVAVKGDQVLAVGDNAMIAAMKGPTTMVIDARGGAVTPGLIDTHTHFVFGGASLDQIDLNGLRDAKDLSDRIARYVKTHPDRQWITGYGYVPDSVTLADFDKAAGNHPAAIRIGDGHSIFANSRALAIAHIDRNTPDPAGGRIVRDATGNPNGHLLEAAMQLMTPALPKPTKADIKRQLDLATKYAQQSGVTTVVNIGGTDDLALLEEERANGTLGVRVAMALWLTENSASNEVPDSFVFTPEDAAKFDRIRESVRPDSWLKLDLVKIMSDGVIESHTAGMLQPFSDDPHNIGHMNYTPGELSRVITMMDARGWHIMTHALGDRAVHETLDAYNDAIAANPVPAGGRRHKIEHIESIDPADIPRFKELGITASLQPAHALGMTDPAMRGKRWRYIGYQRSAWGWPWRSLKDAGAKVAFGSDWPVAPLNIGSAFYSATSRVAHPPVPGQNLTPREVIDGYTRDAAWSIFVEGDRGSLEPGKKADIVVFRNDIFTQRATLGDAPVAYTILDGRIVYRAGNGAGGN